MGHQQRIAESVSKQDEHKHAAKTNSTATSDTAYLQSSSDGLTNRQRNILNAQRTIGNQAVMRSMVQRDEDPAAPGGPQLGQPGSGITASGGVVSIDAPILNIGSAAVNSQAAMHTNAGVLKTETLIADSVVGASYTPGAGNVW
jgi:hypothetical protein